MPLQLPVEVLGRIAACLFTDNGSKSSPDILNLLIVSPTFKTETERLIYVNLNLKGLRQVLQCLSTIDKRPHLARLVRSLTIRVPLTEEPPNLPIFEMFQTEAEVIRAAELHRLRNVNLGRVLKPFARLVTRTLAKLANLIDYSLSMGLLQRLPRNENYFVSIFLPSPASFRLRRLAIDVNWTESVRQFLITQPSITDLIAPEFFPLKEIDGFTFPRTALPNLRGLAASAQVAAQLVPGRPVRKVIMKELVLRASTLGKISDALPFLAQSTTKLKILDIAIREVGMAIETLWPTMVLLFPELETLALRRESVTPESTDLYAIYRSESFCQGLASFKKLKHIILPGLSSYKILQDAGILPPMAHAAQFIIHADINAQIIQGPPPGHPGPPVFGPPPPPHLAVNQPLGPPPPNAVTGTFTVPLGIVQQAPLGAGGVLDLQLPPFTNFLQGLMGFGGLNDAPPVMNLAPMPQGVAPILGAGPPVPPAMGPQPLAQQPVALGNPIHFAQTFLVQGGNAMVAPPQQLGGNGQQTPNAPGIQPLNPGEQQAMLNAFTQATNHIIQMITGVGVPPPPPANEQLPADGEEIFSEDEDMPDLEFVPEPEAGHEPGIPLAEVPGSPTPEPQDLPLANELPEVELITFQPQQWPINMLGPIGPQIAGAGDSRRAQNRPDPKRIEALDKAQKGAKNDELKVLETWTLGGYTPDMHTVQFNILPHRRTTWTKASGGLSAAQPGIAESAQMDGHLDDWEVTYYSK